MPLDWTARFGSTSVMPVLGDIADQRVDVILNSANTRMILGGRDSVAGTILQKTKGRVAEALARVATPVELGALVVTEGFNLPCQHIFHLAVHGTEEEEAALGDDDLAVRMEAVGKGIAAAIRKAEEFRLVSLAMPLFATGTLGYPVQIMIGLIVNTLASELTPNTTLHEVRIVTRRDRRIHGTVGLALRAHIQGMPYISPEAERPQDSQPPLGKHYGALLSALSAVNTPLISAYIASGATSIVGEAVAALLRKHPAPQKDVGAVEAPDRSMSPSADQAEEALARAIHTLQAENFNLRERLRISEEEKERLSEGTQSAPSTEHPLPVAFAESMVASETSPPLRVENLRRAFSIFIKYLAVIGISEYVAAGRPSLDLNAEIATTLKRPLTDGSWLKIATNIARGMKGATPLVVREYHTLMFREDGAYSELNKALHNLLTCRNQVHDNNPFDESTAIEWLERAEPLWRGALLHASPALQYQLVFVDDLLDFGTIDPEAHQYYIRWLMGEHFVPRAQIIEWRQRLRKGRLYLKNAKDERFLALYPFMLYEHCTLTRARETWCLDSVWEDAVSFSTFRFPYKWKDTGCVGEFRSMFSLSN